MVDYNGPGHELSKVLHARGIGCDFTAIPLLANNIRKVRGHEIDNTRDRRQIKRLTLLDTKDRGRHDPMASCQSNPGFFDRRLGQLVLGKVPWLKGRSSQTNLVIVLTPNGTIPNASNRRILIALSRSHPRHTIIQHYHLKGQLTKVKVILQKGSIRSHDHVIGSLR
jgi:hypothetical protein